MAVLITRPINIQPYINAICQSVLVADTITELQAFCQRMFPDLTPARYINDHRGYFVLLTKRQGLKALSSGASEVTTTRAFACAGWLGRDYQDRLAKKLRTAQ